MVCSNNDVSTVGDPSFWKHSFCIIESSSSGFYHSSYDDNFFKLKWIWKFHVDHAFWLNQFLLTFFLLQNDLLNYDVSERSSVYLDWQVVSIDLRIFERSPFFSLTTWKQTYAYVLDTWAGYLFFKILCCLASACATARLYTSNATSTHTRTFIEMCGSARSL